MSAQDKQPLARRYRAQKDTVLRVALGLFALSYPLSYGMACFGSTPAMAAAFFLTAAGCLLVAVL